MGFLSQTLSNLTGVATGVLGSVTGTLSNTVNSVASGAVSSIIGSSAGAVGTIIQSVGDSQILNQAGGTAIAQGLGGLLGGGQGGNLGNISSFNVGNSNTGIVGINTLDQQKLVNMKPPTTFFGKLFNYYKVTEDGTAYVFEGGAFNKQLVLNYPKILLHITIVGVGIYGIYKWYKKGGRR